jgi:hypothetical protein
LVGFEKDNVQEFRQQNDTEAGHMRSGRAFREFHIENMFKQKYGDEGFYSGEEADMMDEEHLELAMIE